MQIFGIFRSQYFFKYLSTQVGNPIHAYNLIRRFSIDIGNIEKDIQEDDWAGGEIKFQEKYKEQQKKYKEQQTMSKRLKNGKARTGDVEKMRWIGHFAPCCNKLNRDWLHLARSQCPAGKLLEIKGGSVKTCKTPPVCKPKWEKCVNLNKTSTLGGKQKEDRLHGRGGTDFHKISI